MIIILFIFLIVPLLVFCYILWDSKTTILTRFEIGNVLVCGTKGKGKDVLFNYVINKRNRIHYANMPYTKKTIVEPIEHYDLKGNTFEKLIQGEYVSAPSQIYESADIYISDGGIFLPSHHDNLLSKMYRSFPIAYALSRQAWNNNIHLNTQCLGRLWIKLREQADTYIRVRKRIKLPFFILLKMTVYDNYQDCESNLKPLKQPLFDNRESKALRQIEETGRGDLLKDCYILVRKKSLTYDTRYLGKKVISEQLIHPKLHRKFI